MTLVYATQRNWVNKVSFYCTLMFRWKGSPWIWVNRCICVCVCILLSMRLLHLLLTKGLWTIQRDIKHNGAQRKVRKMKEKVIIFMTFLFSRLFVFSWSANKIFASYNLSTVRFNFYFILFYVFFLNHKIQPVKRNIHLNIQGSDAEMRMLTYALRWPAPFIRSSNKYSVRFCFYLCWCCCCCFRKYIIYNAID